MKQIQIILLVLFCAFTGFNAAGQANANLNILTLNSGQVNQGAVVDLQVSVGNTGPTSDIGVNKVRFQISIPIAIATALPTAQQTGLPAGWIVLTNTGSAITVCNGTDVIPVGQQRQIFIKIQGTAVGGPSTINGSLSFGPGSGVCTGPGSLPGDNTADNTSTSSITVLPAAVCNLGVSASAGTIACNGGTTTLTATATGAGSAVEYSLNGGAFQASNVFTVNAALSPYTVTARESGNTSCTATTSAVTVTEPSAIIASASAGTINCFGGTTTLTATASGGTAPLQYSLNGGAYQSANTFTVNAAGSPYTVTVRDANLCTIPTSSVTVNQPNQLTATATSTAVTTVGGSNGTATAVPVGGTSPYSYSWAPGGQTTITASGLTAGSYTVTVTDSKGCTTTAATTVGSPACNVTASASAGTIACNGGTTTLTATATGAAAPVQYSLNGGAFQSANTFTVGAGTYIVSVKDANNCTATAASVVVTEPTAISASAAAGTINCFGGTTTLTVTATGGTAPLQYSLNSGAYQSANTFTVNAAGSPYTVTVRDASLCTKTTSQVTVTQPTQLTATATSTAVTTTGGSNGTATAIPVGGTSPYSYSWAPGGQTTVTVSGLAAGSYTVTITDSKGCTTTATTTVGSPACNVTASASAGSAILCNAGTTTLTVTATGAAAPVQYSIDGGATFQPGNVFTVTAGTYTATVKDANNCTATASAVAITQPTAVVVSGGAQPIALPGGTTTVTINATGGTAPYTGTGSFVRSAGTYTFTVTDANGCTGSTTLTLNDPVAGNANASLNILTLNSGQVNLGGTVDLQVSVGNTGPSFIGVNKVRAQISIPVAIATALPNAQQTGLPAGWIILTNTGGTITICNGTDQIPSGEQRQLLIKIQGTTAGGPSTINGSLSFGPGSGVCTGPGSLPGDNTADNTSTSSITVVSTCNLGVTASAGTIACNGGTTTLTATATGAAGAVEYSLNGGTFQSGNTFTVNAAGSPYTVTAREVATTACTATASAVTVTQPTVLSATATSTAVTTTGGSDGTATAIPVGGTSPYSYSWAPGGQTTVTASGLTAGSYTVTITDWKGCTTTATTTVGSPVAGPLTATVVKNNLSVCGGTMDGSITVTATGGLAPYTYSWTGETGSNHTPFTAGNVASITGLNYGYYNVTVTDANLSHFTISNIHIEVGYAVYVTSSGGVSSSCGNTGSILLYGNAGVQPYSYSLNGTTYQPGNTFTGLAAGTYTGYVKDAGGCVSTKPNIIVGSAAPVTMNSFVRAATSCANDGSIEIYRSGGIPPYSYSLDNVTYVSGSVFTNLAAGPYTAYVKDAQGCTASQSVTVTQGAAVAVTAGKSNTSTCVNDGAIQANASGGVGPYTYKLDNGSYQSSNTFTGLGAGTYIVTVKDSKGCLGTISITISLNNITATASTTNASGCASNNGKIQLFVAGGVGPYMYSINGNSYQSSNNFTTLTAGTYTGFVKDSKGCVGMLPGIVVGPAGCSAPIVSTNQSTLVSKGSVEIVNTLKVQAYPNPSATAFTLALEGFDNTKAINVTVTDVLGRIVYQTNGIAKLQYKFGNGFIAGTYTVQVVQGNERKSLKIVKE